MKFRKMRGISVAAGALLVAGCATAPGKPNGGLASQVRETFASDDPCSNNARNIGIAGGAILGMVLGNSMGDGKSGSKVVGAVLGGMLGGLIGSDMDRKRCELSKIAKQFDLDMTFSAINASGEVIAGPQANAAANSSADKSVIGSTVTVRDKAGAAGHFESGSDRLTPKAREYFAAIGAQYSDKNILAVQADTKSRQEAGKQLAKRRIFLIGHTDDTGSSDLNASLSERRAKAVAAYLKLQGIPEESLYFQGAGETLPVADNRTEAGRASNRRVEIVEVADDTIFKKYLEARKPDYQFYRAAMATAANDKGINKDKPEPASKTTASTNPAVKAPANISTSASASTSNKPAVVNFGGTPYSPHEATLNVGALVPEKTSSSLLSKSYASDTVVMTDCTTDRPRAAGSVKSLHDGTSYKTSEHMPQLFGKTWADNVNGNLLVINRLAVLRDGGKPANLPELKVYSQYNPAISKKPVVNEEPRVNSYMVGEGILYRMFPRGDAGLKCVDLLFSTDGSTSAKGGKLIYTSGSADFVANIKPQVQQ